MSGLGEYIGFVPGFVLSIVIAMALGPRVARRLRVDLLSARVLVVSLGIVLAATVTPGRDAVLGVPQTALGCDLSRLGLASWSTYRQINETSLNVLLFVPLGTMVGLLPNSVYRRAVILGVIVLPFAIEGVQLAATPLGRACQSGDVVDNLVGLLLGLGVAIVARALRRRLRPRSQPGVGG